MTRSMIAILSGYSLLLTSRLPELIVRETVKPNAALPQPGWFLAYLLLSAAFGAASGYVTASIARRSELRHALALSIVFVVTGLIASAPGSVLSVAWYHLGLLVLMLPCIFLGAFFRQIKMQPRRR